MTWTIEIGTSTGRMAGFPAYHSGGDDLLIDLTVYFRIHPWHHNQSGFKVVFARGGRSRVTARPGTKSGE